MLNYLIVKTLFTVDNLIILFFTFFCLVIFRKNYLI